MARRLAAAALKPGASAEEVQAGLAAVRGAAKRDPAAFAALLKRLENAAKVYGVVGLEFDRR
jgi:hypothetical protein